MISFEGVTFSYNGKTNALDNLHLQIPQGDFLCVMGANGSGKSTLARLINGLLLPTSGCVLVRGEDTRDPSLLPSIRSQVGFVFQNPDDALVTTIVRDEVAFGPGNLGVPASELAVRVGESLRQVGLEGFENCDVSTLSGGQKQRVCLAGALALHPAVLVMDEATAMLDPEGRRRILELAKSLNKAGMTVVWITHFPEEALQAKRIALMSAGALQAMGTPDEIMQDEELLQRAGLTLPLQVSLQQELAKTCPVESALPVGSIWSEEQVVDRLRRVIRAQGKRTEESSPFEEVVAAMPVTQGACWLLEAQDVSFSYNAEGKQALQGVSLAVARGQLWGIAGGTGSGKSTLLRLLGGLAHPTRGKVLFEGEDLSVPSVIKGARGRLGVVFQYPEQQLFAATVHEDVAFGPKNLGLPADKVAALVEESLRMVGLDPQRVGTCSPFALSGGEQRRVAVAGVLALDPEILIFDEPTAGLDHSAHQRFLALLVRLKEQGKTIILVSHDMEDLAQLCDGVLVLSQGCVVCEGSPQRVFATERPELEAIGMPFAQRIARRADMTGFYPTVESLLAVI